MQWTSIAYLPIFRDVPKKKRKNFQNTKRRYPCCQWATRICYPSNSHRHMPCDKHRSQWMQNLLWSPPLRPGESCPKRHAWPWIGLSCHRPSEQSALAARTVDEASTPFCEGNGNCSENLMSNWQTQPKKVCDVKLYIKLPTSHSSGRPSWNFNFPKQVSYSSLVVMPSGTFANDMFSELEKARSRPMGPRWLEIHVDRSHVPQVGDHMPSVSNVQRSKHGIDSVVISSGGIAPQGPRSLHSGSSLLLKMMKHDIHVQTGLRDSLSNSGSEMLKLSSD